jgi:hypothetical protein
VTVTLRNGGGILARDQSSDPDDAIVRLFEAMPALCDLYLAAHPELQQADRTAAENLIDGL